MRSPWSWTRGATCALVVTTVSIFASVTFADTKTKKSLAACTSFDQADKGDDAVELTIHNSCTIPIDCSISWRVVCAPDSKKRRASHAKKATLALVDGTSQSTQATASMCGDDAWSIDSIQWSCEPNKE
jgi:hypothetical protein